MIREGTINEPTTENVSGEDLNLSKWIDWFGLAVVSLPCVGESLTLGILHSETNWKSFCLTS